MKENYLASNSNTDESSEATLHSNEVTRIEQIEVFLRKKINRAHKNWDRAQTTSDKVRYGGKRKAFHEVLDYVLHLLNSEQTAPVCDASKAETTTSSDNQTSQIADKDWREQLKEAWGSFESHEDAIYFIEQYFTSTNGYDKLLQEHYELADELSRLKEENERLRSKA